MTFSQGSKGAHIGGALSLVEIMAVLYGHISTLGVTGLDEDRDRIILSKGHGAMAMYSAMKEFGVLTASDLETFKKNDSFLSAHPSLNREHRLEYASGSLGQGLSIAVGVSLGLKRKNNNKSKIYVILGDGECDEGSVWEAAQSAAHFNCNNITAIIDNNKLQYDGATSNIMSQGDFAARWSSTGWIATEVDGHSIPELLQALSASHDKPLVVIADTIKGKGVSFMENNPEWHNHSLTAEQYKNAMDEISAI